MLNLYFDPREPIIYSSWFQGDSVENFKDQYLDAKEQLPPSQIFPDTRGVLFSTTAYMDDSRSYN